MVNGNLSKCNKCMSSSRRPIDHLSLARYCPLVHWPVGLGTNSRTGPMSDVTIVASIIVIQQVEYSLPTF
jgi:hypothetical protein